jgi:acyl-coenzyme A synthetase/AMP-(fatty) acid ligase
LLTINGRIDRRVKIGGVHVSPVRIETLLRAHNRVHDVHVVAGEGSDGNAVLVAHVHPASANDDELRAELVRIVRRSGHTNEVPGEIVFHPGGLPRLPSGKVDAVALKGSSMQANV